MLPLAATETETFTVNVMWTNFYSSIRSPIGIILSSVLPSATLCIVVLRSGSVSKVVPACSHEATSYSLLQTLLL